MPKVITKVQGASEGELAVGAIENEMMTEIEGVAEAEEAIFEIFKNNIYIMEKTVYYVIKIYGP